MRKFIIELEMDDSDDSIEEVKHDLQQEISCCSNFFFTENMIIKEMKEGEK